MYISRTVVDHKINEFNEFLTDDLQTKQFQLLQDNKHYYLVDEINQIYANGSLKEIYKAVCLLFVFYCEISA